MKYAKPIQCPRCGTGSQLLAASKSALVVLSKLAREEGYDVWKVMDKLRAEISAVDEGTSQNRGKVKR